MDMFIIKHVLFPRKVGWFLLNVENSHFINHNNVFFQAQTTSYKFKFSAHTFFVVIQERPFSASWNCSVKLTGIMKSGSNKL